MTLAETSIASTRATPAPNAGIALRNTAVSTAAQNFTHWVPIRRERALPLQPDPSLTLFHAGSLEYKAGCFCNMRKARDERHG